MKIKLLIVAAGLFATTGVGAQQKPYSIGYSILKTDNNMLSDGAFEVIVNPKYNNDSLKKVCLNLAKKSQSEYIFVKFWNNLQAYKEHKEPIAQYKGDKYSGNITMTYPDNTIENASKWPFKETMGQEESTQR